MATLTVLALAIQLASSSMAEFNTSDYLHWAKADITAWHMFFPSRALAEENRTIEMAKSAVNSLSTNLEPSLYNIVAFQYQELKAAQVLMNGTDAEGCLYGITDYLSKGIKEVSATYDDCAYDATSKLLRLQNSLSSIKSIYLAAYDRARVGVDVCAKTYPNKDSYSRLISCVESMKNSYNKAANSTQNSVFPSPSMSVFQSMVVGCASDAARSVAAKGYKLLEDLIQCAILSGTVDTDKYKQELDGWKGYDDTLPQQIAACQNRNYYQVLAVEEMMKSYYEMKKQAEQYVVQTRDINYYREKTYNKMSDYYNTVIDTSIDNPGNLDCTTEAKASLDIVASASANKNLACDSVVVNSSKLLFNEIFNSFVVLSDNMPTIGNVAILKCMTEGYVFAPNTISDCFNLVYSEFEANYTDMKVTIEKDVAKLIEYQDSYNSEVDLPCGGTSLIRLLLEGETVLYKLQRCLYVDSGTTYSVTTPPPYTPTTTYPTDPSR